VISTFLLPLFIIVAIRMFSLKIRYTHCLIIIIIIILLSNKHPYMFVTRKKQKQKNNVNKISQFIMNKLRDFCPQF
jgi:TRAP-type uncharacterized transport system fused permease subunit